MKILCLYVRHDTKAYPQSLSVLEEWYTRHGLLGDRTLWIIDNALAADRVPETVDGALVIAGDNRAWEFSSWEQALRRAREAGVAFDVVHFVTSAFNTLYTGYLEHFRPEMLEYVAMRNVCLGHVDGYTDPIELGGVISQSWIRTGFFFLSRAGTSSPAHWVNFPDPSVFFADPNSRAFRRDAPLSVNYQSRLTEWLEGEVIGGHRWHSPVGEGSSENERFQRKTLAILNEHGLAIALRRAGIPLVDFCWLHSVGAIPVASIENPPPESEQLRIRRKILCIPD